MVDQSVDTLREVIRICVRKTGLLQKADASCCGITVAQCHTLVEIGRTKGLSLNELSELLTLDKSTMSRTVDNLVNAGLAVRQADQEDRRYMKITLTPKGSEMVQVINSSMKEYYARVLHSIPEMKRALVSEALPYLLTAIKESDMSHVERQICSGIMQGEKGGCNSERHN